MADTENNHEVLHSEIASLREENAQLRASEVKYKDQIALHRALSMIQEEVWKMERAEDITRILVAVRTSMEDLNIPFNVCGVNIVDETGEPSTVKFHNMTQDGEWLPAKPVDPGVDVVLQFWKDQHLAYRRDLDLEDPYNETEVLDPYFGYHIRCIIDVPFAYGTLAVNSTEPEAFSDRDVAIMQELTESISLGYTRFLDFQRLEAQAKSLDEKNRFLLTEQILERVRTEIAMMKESQDLFKVIAYVEGALEDLEIRCDQHSFNIIDEESGTIKNYWSHGLVKQDGADQGGDAAALFDHWKKGRTFQRFVAEWGRWVVDAPFSHGSLAINRTGREPFSPEDTRLLERLAEIVSLGYNRFLDFQRVDTAQRRMIDELEKELQTAHHMQTSLMPVEAPPVQGFDIAGRCLPATHVGGDFFQYFFGDGKLSICMADATGHAMGAAIPVVMFSGILNGEMQRGNILEQTFYNLNRTLYEALDERTFICLVMGEIDLANRSMLLSNSGCPYPYHYDAATGQLNELQINAYPLGISPVYRYPVVTASFEQGDYVIFCSDGIVEAVNRAKEIFGFDRTAATIRQGCRDDLSAGALIDRLVGGVQEFTGEEPQRDDMTCVVLRVEEQGAGAAELSSLGETSL